MPFLPVEDDTGDGGTIGGGTPTPTPTPTPGATPSPTPTPIVTMPPAPGASSIVSSSDGGPALLFIDAIPIAALPAQTLNVQLGDQSCRINVSQKTTGLYLDLYVNDVPIVLSALCLYNDFIVRDDYLGFSGDLLFLDNQGDSDPEYSGLGGRYALYWVHQ